MDRNWGKVRLRAQGGYLPGRKPGTGGCGKDPTVGPEEALAAPHHHCNSRLFKSNGTFWSPPGEEVAEHVVTEVEKHWAVWVPRAVCKYREGEVV